MKIWLDDLRPLLTPNMRSWDDNYNMNDWHWVTSAEELIVLLSSPKLYLIDEIDLDHDLGDYPLKTGYEVLLWIEEQVFTNPNYNPPKMYIHTANPSAEKKMWAAIDRIEKMVNKRLPYPDCYKNCKTAKFLGVGECENVCIDKFKK